MELKNDLCITGTLHSVDQYLNIKLNNIRVINQQKYPHMLSVRNCFIRGSVVRYVQVRRGTCPHGAWAGNARPGPAYALRLLHRRLLQGRGACAGPGLWAPGSGAGCICATCRSPCSYEGWGCEAVAVALSL